MVGNQVTSAGLDQQQGLYEDGMQYIGSEFTKSLLPMVKTGSWDFPGGLVVRVCLSMQGTCVQYLVWTIPCAAEQRSPHTAAEPARLEPTPRNKRSLHLPARHS